MDRRLQLTMLLAAGLAVSTVGAAAAKGKPGGGGGAGGGGGGDACVAAESRIAFTAQTDGIGDLYAVNPDGTCLTQLTTGGSAGPVYAWTDDNHVLVRSNGTTGSMLLSVPDSTDPASVSTVYTYSRVFEVISQHQDATGVLSAGEQLLLGFAADGLNLVACTADGATCTQLTNYSPTYVEGGTGTSYLVADPQWLPPSADNGRIRLKYYFGMADWVNGEPVDSDSGLRVISLGTSDWPTISTGDLTDNWIGGRDEDLDGLRFGDINLVDFSRDGANAAVRGATGPGPGGIYIVPAVYDDIAGTVDLDVPNASHIATDVVEFIYNDFSFSPDGSQIGYNGSEYVGKGGNRLLVHSIYVIGTDQQSGSVEVDGQPKNYTCCTVWGP